MSIDLLYLCHGRLEFTKQTLPNLHDRTDWDLVDNFVVYNDATPERDGATSKFVREFIDFAGFGVLRETNLGSPVGVMNHFLNRTQCKLFAKIDNDIIVPDYWLRNMLGVMDANPDLDLLGAEPGMSGVPPLDEPNDFYLYDHVECSHIGGVGLMRRAAFDRFGHPVADGRFGFTEWQHNHLPKRGWIRPDLRLFALDLLPVEPWRSLTDGYKKIDGFAARVAAL